MPAKHKSTASSDSPMIETYVHRGKGYNPFLIRDGWQVAQLNYMPEQRASAIHKVDRHLATDEVFILSKGKSVLIAAKESANGLRFKIVRMKPGVTYNIHRMMWHNIAMLRGDQVMIVEKSNTHLGDFEYRPLGAEEERDLQAKIKRSMRINGSSRKDSRNPHESIAK